MPEIGGNTPRDSELKNALLFFALAAIVFAAFYFFDIGGIFGAGIGAASILAVGISRAIAARKAKAETRA